MKAAAARPQLLDARQIRWLGTLLLAVQVQQAIHMPAWIAVGKVAVSVGGMASALLPRYS